MKKTITFALILLLNSFCLPQYKNNPNFSGGLGLVFPGTRLESYKTGINFNADFQIPFSKTLGLRIDLQYSSLPLDAKNTEGGRFNLLSFCPNLTVGTIFIETMNGSASLYGFGGFGFFFPSTTDLKTPLGTIRGESAELRFGANLGIRGIFKLKNNNLGFFDELGVKIYDQGKADAASITYFNIGVSYFLKK